MAKPLLTPAQKATVRRLIGPTAANDWSRALSAGERVTLASLYSRGFAVRRPWRGREGEPDSAYEYKLTPALLDSLYRKTPDTVDALRRHHLYTKENG
jgi:hypothetical protein